MTKLSKEYAHVPKKLKGLDRWLVWKSLPPDKPGGKPRKCPWDLPGACGLDGTRISSGRPFAEIVAAYETAKPGTLAGIGFILGDDIAGTDCDDCIASDGQLDTVGIAQADAFAGTYMEVSPSGNGFKSLCLVDERVGHVGKKVGHEELYSGKRWFAITGQPLPGYESKVLADRSDAFLAMINRLSARNVTVADDVDLGPSNSGDHFLRFHMPGLTLKIAVDLLSSRDPNCSNADWRNRYMLAWALQFGMAGFESFDDWSSDGITYPGTQAVLKEYERCMRDNAKLSPTTTVGKVMTLASLRFDVQGEKLKKTQSGNRTFQLETGTEIMKTSAPDYVSVLAPLFTVGLNMLAGLGGTGKTTIAATGAVSVTTGLPLSPFELPSVKREPAGVLWLTVEEDMKGIVVPRHMHLGGDLNLFYRPTIESEQDEDGEWHAVDFDIEKHLLPLLIEAKSRGTPIRLVVCDSLPGLIQWGTRSTTSDPDVKKILGRLNDIAIEQQCCILGIAHWNKKSTMDESLRMSGAQAWRDTPRVSFTVERGYVYINKANDIPEIGCTFEQKVVAVLREFAAVTEDGKPLPMAARRAVFGPYLMSKGDLLQLKAADKAQLDVAPALPALEKKERRIDRLCRETVELFDVTGQSSLPSGYVWKAVRDSYSAPNGDEKKQIIQKLGLALDERRKPVMLSIGSALKAGGR